MKALLTTLLLITALIASSSIAESQQDHDETKHVTILGLGGMGKAVADCFVKTGYHVHGWNRTPRGPAEGMTLYETAASAMAASDFTLIIINSEPNLKSVHELLSSDAAKAALKGKTVVNFVNHEPFEAEELEVMLKSNDIHHISGNFYAVPSTICTPAAILLMSSSDWSKKSLQSAPLDVLGTIEAFEGNVGYGALVNVCLIQTTYFGLAGFEMALLLLEKYGASTEVINRFVALHYKIAEHYTPFLFGIVSKGIQRRDWTNSYVPVGAAAALFEMHAKVFVKLGIIPDNFNAIYLKYLKKTMEAEGPRAAISAVVKHYSTDGFVIQSSPSAITVDEF